jgi:hypothetical protein
MLKRILIQLTEQQLKSLKQISEDEGASVAWQIRKAVSGYLRSKGKKS